MNIAELSKKNQLSQGLKNTFSQKNILNEQLKERLHQKKELLRGKSPSAKEATKCSNRLNLYDHQ